MRYQTLDHLMQASEEELEQIKDIGPIIAKCLVEYFANVENQKEIERLKELGLNMTYTGPKVEVNTDFEGKTFVITGTLSTMTRDEVEEKIALLGGKASSSVSKKTAAVIVGKDPGSKYQKALDLKIPVWTEQDLLNHFNKEEK